MLQALLASGVVFGFLKFLERGRDRGLDGFTALTFVLVPALLIFLVSIGTGIAGVNQQFLFVLWLLYLVVPTLMLRLQFEFSWGRSAGYGLLVFLVAVSVDILFAVLLGGLAT